QFYGQTIDFFLNDFSDLVFAFYLLLSLGCAYELDYHGQEVLIQSPAITDTIASISGCSACGAPDADLACDACGDYQFCSHACSDAVALKHHATCYDKCCAESVEAVVMALGFAYVDHEQGVAVVEKYLENHGALPPAAIAASSKRHRKKR